MVKDSTITIVLVGSDAVGTDSQLFPGVLMQMELSIGQ